MNYRDAAYDLANQLHDLEGKATLLTVQGDLSDFTQDFSGQIVISSPSRSVSFPLSKEAVPHLAPHLLFLFADDQRAVIAWDVKRLFTYLKFNLPRTYEMPIRSKVIDLKLSEAFNGLRGKDCPASWQEAVQRAAVAGRNTSLASMRRLHVPLATRVLPAMEARGVLDGEGLKYCCYEIEGQANGRLSCSRPGKNFLNPHGLTAEQKLAMKPGEGRRFVVLDYKAMEVSVLQWLSGDENLKKVVDGDKDVYEALFEVLTGKACSSEGRREFAKGIFLPVCFGLQAKALAEKHAISEGAARGLISKIETSFPQAMAWLARQVGEEFEDRFGRRRVLERAWAARNAAVQGPAAMVCLEKLVELDARMPKGAELVMSVHDSYVITVSGESCEYDADLMREVLEVPTELCPGMGLKASCMAGDNLSEMAAT